ELADAQKHSGAKALHAIVMDPFTGEIISMAQWSATPDSYGINRNVSNLYEPGSFLKVLFAAEAIELGVLKPHSMIDCGLGKITVNGQVLGEAESDHRYGLLPLEKVIQFSSNVGAVRVAQALGDLRVRATLEKYSLTSKTEVQLPGEANSPMKSKHQWTPLLNATVGFGQGVSVTPLQMVAAMAPFANGGYWVRPKILKSEVGSTQAERQELRRVLSGETVRKMRKMLISVTEGKGGTGVRAKIPGFHVAGKTGTAQKYEAGVGYRSGKYFSSFVGFLPADNPQILVGVMVDEPKAPYYASETAAPLFKRIAERTIQVLDRVPTETMVADLEPLPKKKSKKAPREDAPQLILSGDGKIVMPNLKGLSLKETLQLVGKHLQDVKISGAGYLETQQPPPGTLVQPETPVELTFTPNG
ncbi:MAG: penicillin-binding protein, partial [Pseudobdellovibrionaceae bacterium]